VETSTPRDATPTAASTGDLTPWWTSHADAERTRSTPDPVPGSLEQAGTFEFPSIQNPRTYPLVTTEGLFVFHDGTVARYDLASRESAFQRSVSSGWRFVRDGTIVMVGSNFNLLGLNASSGEREWIASVDLTRTQTRSVSPVPGGVLVVEASGVRVLEVESGEERWSKTVSIVNKLGEVKPMQSGNYPYRPPVHSESDTVFVGHGTHVDALDARTGDRQWRFTRDKEFETLTAEPAPLAVRGETVYVPDRDGILALDRGDGSVRWKRTPSDGDQNPFTRDFAYAVDDTALYYWNSVGEVRALSVDDGSDLWSTAFAGRVTRVGSAVADDGVVFTTANGLRVLSKSTGELRLSTDLKDPLGVVPAGGRLYVVNFSESGRAQITVYGSS
jgi:outer membrane protein assembly factor BamB